jgi:hypothetical protein
MKKILRFVLTAIFFSSAVCLSAIEIKVEGTGKASITGYDISSVRDNQDVDSNKLANKKQSEKKKDKQIDKAIKQSNKRKQQDSDLSDSVRVAVVKEAQDNAVKNALNILLDRVLGAGASKDTSVQDKFEDIYSQSGVYTLDKQFSGETSDSEYIAKVSLTIDETAFRELVSDMGIALNTQKVRQSAILIVMDEFFAAPSNLKPAPTKEITTNITTKEQKRVKSEAAAVDYENGFGEKASAAYGKFSDLSGKDTEFYQKIVEYAVNAPVAENLNYTQPALANAFVTYDIRSLDNDIFKSKFFKGQGISADKLSNSEELSKYVEYAKTEAKADFFAIGVSYITDDGKNENTGKNTASGNVFVKIYSTQDGEIIASGSLSEIASGNSSDGARVNVANKIGNELGEVLSKKIQDYWKKRSMYGSEYIVQVFGSFLPIERISLNKAIKETPGVEAATLRNSDNTKCEYTVSYNGNDPVGDAIFLKLSESNLAGKFGNYDYKGSGNNVIFSPIGKTK